MKKTIIIAMLVCLTGLMVGCNPRNLEGGDSGHGMVRTPAERSNSHALNQDIRERQLNDDWDLFWLNDRSSRLTDWKSPW